MNNPLQYYNLIYNDTLTYTKKLTKILVTTKKKKNSKEQKIYKNPKKMKILDLSNCRSSLAPQPKLLAMFQNLLELNLTYNKIVKFDAVVYSNLLPKLEIFIIDKNRIDDIRNFEQLNMPNLRVLSFQDNPLIDSRKGDYFRYALSCLIWSKSPNKKDNSRHDFKPESYVPNSKGVFGGFTEQEIFTAHYEFVALKPEGYKEYVIGEFREDRDEDLGIGDNEFGLVYDTNVEKMRLLQGEDVGYGYEEEKGLKNPIKVMNGLKWIFSVIDKPCPKRKIGRFRNLEKLNGKTITIYDIYRISGLRNKVDFLQDEVEEKVEMKIKRIQEQNLEREKKNEKKLPPKPDSVFNDEYYLKNYERRKKRAREKYQPILYIGALPNINNPHLYSVEPRTRKRQEETGTVEKDGDEVRALESRVVLNKNKNYLKLVLLLDQTNNYRKKLLTDILQGDTVKAEFRKRVPISFLNLREQTFEEIEAETLKLKNRNLALIEEEKLKSQFNYRRSLRKVYKFRKWKDEIGSDTKNGNFEKIFGLKRGELLVDYQNLYGEYGDDAKEGDVLGDGKFGVLYGAKRNKLDEVLQKVGATMEDLEVYNKKLVTTRGNNSLKYKPSLVLENANKQFDIREDDLEEKGENIGLDKDYMAHIEEMVKMKKEHEKQDLMQSLIHYNTQRKAKLTSEERQLWSSAVVKLIRTRIEIIEANKTHSKGISLLRKRSALLRSFSDSKKKLFVVDKFQKAKKEGEVKKSTDRKARVFEENKESRKLRKIFESSEKVKMVPIKKLLGKQKEPGEKSSDSETWNHSSQKTGFSRSSTSKRPKNLDEKISKKIEKMSENGSKYLIPRSNTFSRRRDSKSGSKKLRFDSKVQTVVFDSVQSPKNSIKTNQGGHTNSVKNIDFHSPQVVGNYGTSVRKQLKQAKFNFFKSDSPKFEQLKQKKKEVKKLKEEKSASEKDEKSKSQYHEMFEKADLKMKKMSLMLEGKLYQKKDMFDFEEQPQDKEESKNDEKKKEIKIPKKSDFYHGQLATTIGLGSKSGGIASNFQFDTPTIKNGQDKLKKAKSNQAFSRKSSAYCIKTQSSVAKSRRPKTAKTSTYLNNKNKTSYFNSQKRKGNSGLGINYGNKFSYSNRNKTQNSSRKSKRSRSERKKPSKHSKKILERRQFDYSIGLKKPKDGYMCSMLGYRPMFKITKEFKRNKHNRVVHKEIKPEDQKMVNPKDFYISDEMFIPGEKEGLSKIEQFKLKAYDEKNGNYVEKYKTMVQESMAAVENLERVQNSYYIHNPRKEAFLKQPRHVVTHELVFKILQDLFPNKDYLGKDNLEFRKIYDDINGLEEMKDYTTEQVEMILKDPEIGENNKREFEKFMEHVEASSNQRKHKFLDNEVLWKKAVEKEFEQKQHKAILAAHYLKLKDYYVDKKCDRYAKKLIKNSVSNFDITAIRDVKGGLNRPITALVIPKNEADLKKLNKETEIKKKEIEFVQKNLEKIDPPVLENKLTETTFQEEESNIKTEESEKIAKIPEEKEDFYHDYVTRLASKIIDRGYKTPQTAVYTDTDVIRMNPHIMKNFNAVKFKGVCISKKKPLKGRVPIRKFSRKWTWTFESELERAKLRNIMKQSEENGLSDKQKLLNYAHEFKVNAKKSQKLFQSVKTEILPGMEKKMEDFYRYQDVIDDLRYDKEKCMRKFVKDVIDGVVE